MKELAYFWDTPAEGKGHFPQRFATFFFGLVRVIFTPLFRLRIVGSLPDARKNYLVCGNHYSYLDPVFVLLAVRPRPLRFLAKQEFFNNSIIARLASWVGAFPIVRGAADTKAIKRAVTMLKRGELVGIFPEGTRGREGQERQAHEGISLIANKAAAEVLPMRIWGTDKISPPGAKRWHFPQVTVAFGQPLSLNDKRYADLQKAERYALFAQDCLDAIYAIEPPGAGEQPERPTPGEQPEPLEARLPTPPAAPTPPTPPELPMTPEQPTPGEPPAAPELPEQSALPNSPQQDEEA